MHRITVGELCKIKEITKKCRMKCGDNESLLCFLSELYRPNK